MRAYPRIYNQPAFAKNYTIVEILAMVDAGTIQAKPIQEIRRIRAIVKSNIEAQKAWGRTTLGYVSAGHWAMVKKLESYLRRMPCGR
jgi:hypothetical protein